MKVGNIAADNMAVGHLNRLKQRNSLGPSRDGQNYAVVHCTGYIKNWPPSGEYWLQHGGLETVDTGVDIYVSVGVHLAAGTCVPWKQHE